MAAAEPAARTAVPLPEVAPVERGGGAPPAERGPDLELVRTLYISGPWGLAVQALGAATLLAISMSRAAGWRMGVWLMLFVAVGAWRWTVLRRYWSYMMSLAEEVAPGRADTGPVADGPSRLRRAQHGWDMTVVAGAVTWALGELLFYPGADAPEQLALTLLGCSACVAQPVTRYVTYVMCVGLGFGSVALCELWMKGPHAGDVLAVLALAMVVALAVAWGYRSSFRALFALQARARAVAARLAAQTEAAERSRRQAEEAAHLRSRFFTAASHDLRQPLHGLGLFVQALGGQPLPAEARTMVQRAVESIDALEGMFDELLDLNRIEQGRLDPATRAVLLAPLAHRLAGQLDPVAFDKGVTLRFSGMRGAVRADELMLERVLRNLVVNALRHTDDGGVLVTARPLRGAVRLQVWDTGSGVPPEALARIFDAYYQAGGGRPGAGGLGIGLAIAQGLAGAMGADLTVRSQVGRGTVFTLLLPAADAAAAVPPTSPLLTLTGRRIAVVTPDPREQADLAALFARWSATVSVFADATAARHGLAAPPDLMVVACECVPSGVDEGADAIARALEDAFGTVVPTVLLVRAAATVMPASRTIHPLARPVKPARLRALVTHLLSGAGSARA